MDSYTFYIFGDVVNTVRDTFEVQAESPEQAKKKFFDAIAKGYPDEFFVESDSFIEVKDYSLDDDSISIEDESGTCYTKDGQEK